MVAGLLPSRTTTVTLSLSISSGFEQIMLEYGTCRTENVIGLVLIGEFLVALVDWNDLFPSLVAYSREGSLVCGLAVDEPLRREPADPTVPRQFLIASESISLISEEDILVAATGFQHLHVYRFCTSTHNFLFV